MQVICHDADNEESIVLLKQVKVTQGMGWQQCTQTVSSFNYTSMIK